MIEALEPYVHTVCFFDPQGQAKRLLELFRRRTGALPYPDKLGRVVMLQSVARITEHRTKRKISKAAPKLRPLAASKTKTGKAPFWGFSQNTIFSLAT